MEEITKDGVTHINEKNTYNVLFKINDGPVTSMIEVDDDDEFTITLAPPTQNSIMENSLKFMDSEGNTFRLYVSNGKEEDNWNKMKN